MDYIIIRENKRETISYSYSRDIITFSRDKGTHVVKRDMVGNRITAREKAIIQKFRQGKEQEQCVN